MSSSQVVNLGNFASLRRSYRCQARQCAHEQAQGLARASGALDDAVLLAHNAGVDALDEADLLGVGLVGEVGELDPGHLVAVLLYLESDLVGLPLAPALELVLHNFYAFVRPSSISVTHLLTYSW